MEKVLMLASVASMIDQFNMENIQILQDLGYDVHIAANFEIGNASSPKRIEEFKEELMKKGVTYYQIDFSRKITNPVHIYKAYHQVKVLLVEGDYKFIHCHTPIGGACGRMAGNATNIPVIYTAHGFHFYKGVSFINWLLFYPIERWLARYTDILVTINVEDYTRASKSFKPQETRYIPGVGVEINKFSLVTPMRDIRKELNIPQEAILMLSVGELNANKNHQTVIEAIARLQNPDLYYVICGQGNYEKRLMEMAKKLGIDRKVKLIGYRRNVAEIYHVADIFVFPSYREGLPVAMMEAMASKLPVVGSKVRGITDLIVHDHGGYLNLPNDSKAFANHINTLIQSPSLRSEFGSYNREKIKQFDRKLIMKDMRDIYSSMGGELVRGII